MLYTQRVDKRINMTPKGRRASPSRDPRSFLPLTPRVYHVLLALAQVPLHGYGVILAVQDLTEGVIVMRTGTLYVLLRRLLNQRLIEACEDRPQCDEDDERRRYYRLTELGRAVLEAESLRLQSVVAVARRTLGLRRS
jgi:DNA-binding PadR family transcriptional regulator